MIDIKKNRSDFGLNDIVITQGEKKFQLLFGGDGYLYWTMIDLEQDTNGIVRFPITKENYMLYSLIEDVYEKVRNCQVFDVSDVELEFCDTTEERAALFAKKKNNDDLKRFSAYKKLYDQNTGIISWYDDESIYDEGNVVNIIPKDEEFILEFVLGVHCDAYDVIGVRFRNSGSTYTPFNNVFMDMFNTLQEYDPDYHQIHIEEYLY